jgi:hypothetical protein
VVVPVPVVDGVTVTVVDVVGVILVRDGDMSAPLTVLMVVTFVGGMAAGGAFVDVVAVDPVNVAVVGVVGVVAVRDGHVSAALAVGVYVVLVRAVVGGSTHGGSLRIPLTGRGLMAADPLRH